MEQPDLTRPKQEGEYSSRRIDWESNHQKIQEFVSAYMGTNKVMPSYQQITDATEITLVTVKRHIQELKNDKTRFDKFRALTDDVLFGMWRASKAGDARAGKLFLQFVEEWEERKKITQVNDNPYAGMSEEEIRKKAEQRRAGILARKKAMDAARDI